MALKVKITIRSTSGYGSPLHEVEGSADEVAGYLGLHGEDWDGKGSTLQAQLHKVAAWAAQDFDSLNPGKG